MKTVPFHKTSPVGYLLSLSPLLTPPTPDLMSCSEFQQNDITTPLFPTVGLHFQSLQFSEFSDDQFLFVFSIAVNSFAD